MPKLLLVEDDEANRDMLMRRLCRKGYEVSTALDGPRGIEAAHATHPDLIIMDMTLPVLDGVEAAKRLKADPETRSIPIIALTAHTMDSDREVAFHAGFDDFDTKPVDFARLVQKIEFTLAKKGSAR